MEGLGLGSQKQKLIRAPALKGEDRELASHIIRDLAALKWNDTDIVVELVKTFPTATVSQVRNIREENNIPAGASRGRPKATGSGK